MKPKDKFKNLIDMFGAMGRSEASIDSGYYSGYAIYNLDAIIEEGVTEILEQQ